MDPIFTDKASCKDTQHPQPNVLLAVACDGDTVVVHSMDRLVRNLDDVRRVVKALTGWGVWISSSFATLLSKSSSLMATYIKLDVEIG